MIYNSILETIGDTPVVRLNRMAPEHVELFVKVESFNPMASVKDRLAVVRDELPPGYELIIAQDLSRFVDDSFNEALDCLIMLDLRQTDHKVLAKYMGSEAASAFLERADSVHLSSAWNRQVRPARSPTAVG